MKQLLLATIPLLLASCSTRLATKVYQSGGNVIVQEEANPSPLLLTLPPGTPFFHHELVETNYFFFSTLNFRLQVGSFQPESLPQAIPLKIVLTFPGRLLEQNASSLKPHIATWHFQPGKPLEAHLRSLSFHFFPTLALLLSLIAAALLRRRLKIEPKS